MNTAITPLRFSLIPKHNLSTTNPGFRRILHITNHKRLFFTTSRFLPPRQQTFSIQSHRSIQDFRTYYSTDNKSSNNNNIDSNNNAKGSNNNNDKSITKKVIDAAVAAATKTKHENIYTVPNMLTFSRLITAPVIGYLVVHHQTTLAFGLFALSCFTDLLDGYIARKYELQTVVGSVIDPMADKALMMTLASCLAVSGDIPLYAAIVILGRDVLLAIAAVLIRYKSLPPPKTFSRYWDFSLPSAEVHPTQISKYNTFLQMLYLGSSLMYPAVYGSLDAETAQLAATSLQYLGYTVASTTILSGLSYVFSTNAVKIVKQS